jgi:tRNA 2-thiocytidine biosynthesis protein TtcA
MLEKGDGILIGLSGGGDSLALLDILAYQRKAIGPRLKLRLVAGHAPGRIGGRPIVSSAVLQRLCRQRGIPFHQSRQEMDEPLFSDCFACAQARRRILFDLAEEQGCNKIALGHNADDIIETALLNMLYNGRLAALHPRQAILKGKMAIIRPLAYCWKKDIASFSGETFPRLRTRKCPGSRNNRRMTVRAWLEMMEGKGSPVKANILRALAHPRPEYLPIPTGTNKRDAGRRG